METLLILLQYESCTKLFALWVEQLPDSINYHNTHYNYNMDRFRCEKYTPLDLDQGFCEAMIMNTKQKEFVAGLGISMHSDNELPIWQEIRSERRQFDTK